MELWAQLGDWLRDTFLPDDTGPSAPNGNGRQGVMVGDTTFIDPNGLPHASSDRSRYINPNG